MKAALGFLAKPAAEGDQVSVHICDRCGESFDNSELNYDDKLVLDGSGKWKMETTYRCFECVKKAVFG